MGKKTLMALVAAALVGITTLTLAVPAEAGQGRGYGRGGGWGGGGRYVQNNYYGGGYRGGYRHGGGDALAAGIIGLGVGAIVGSALTPQTVYVAPPPPRPGARLCAGRLRAAGLDAGLVHVLLLALPDLQRADRHLRRL